MGGKEREIAMNSLISMATIDKHQNSNNAVIHRSIYAPLLAGGKIHWLFRGSWRVCNNFSVKIEKIIM